MKLAKLSKILYPTIALSYRLNIITTFFIIFNTIINFTLSLSNLHNLYYFETNFNIKNVKKFNSLIHLYNIHLKVISLLISKIDLSIHLFLLSSPAAINESNSWKLTRWTCNKAGSPWSGGSFCILVGKKLAGSMMRVQLHTACILSHNPYAHEYAYVRKRSIVRSSVAKRVNDAWRA